MAEPSSLNTSLNTSLKRKKSKPKVQDEIVEEEQVAATNENTMNEEPTKMKKKKSKSAMPITNNNSTDDGEPSSSKTIENENEKSTQMWQSTTTLNTSRSPKSRKVAKSDQEREANIKSAQDRATFKSKKRLSAVMNQEDVLVKSQSGKVFALGLGDEPILSTLTAAKENLMVVPLAQKKRPATFEWKDIVAVKRDSPKVFTIITIDHNTKPSKAKRVDHAFMTTTEEETEQWVSFLHPFIHSNLLAPKRVTVIINPFSGTKKAKKIWDKVSSMFEAAGVRADIISTERAGHASEIAKDLDLNLTDALISVSGDGVFHEIVNGLMSRRDWKEATKKLILGVIPAGTGNGLAFSLETNHFAAARNIIKGYNRPMDLNRIKQDGLDLWSFLSIQWALVSDVDKKSEKMRFLGDGRYVVQTLREIVSFKTYPGTLSFIPVKTHEHLKFDEHEKCTKLFSLCSTCDQDLSMHKDIPEQSPVSSDPTKSPKSPKKKRKAKTDGIPDVMDFEINSDWTVIDDQFLLFIAANNNAISKDMVSNPFAHLNDGFIDVVVSRKSNKSLSRGSILKAFLGGFETGEYVKEAMVEYYKVKGFKLVPDAKSILSVDGETIPTLPTTVQNYHNMIRIFSEPEK